MQTVSGSQWRKRLSRRTVVKFPFAALSAKAQSSTSVCRNQTANNCARNRARYRWQLKSAITSPNFALWCNGNTAPFGGVILGSNPSGAATLGSCHLPKKIGNFANAQRAEPKRKNPQYIWQYSSNGGGSSRAVGGRKWRQTFIRLQFSAFRLFSGAFFPCLHGRSCLICNCLTSFCAGFGDVTQSVFQSQRK